MKNGMKNEAIDRSSALVQKVIAILDGIARRKGLDIVVERDTELFESRILDSVSFVEFITALEVELDINVPDQKMSTQYFLTPGHIGRNFDA